MYARRLGELAFWLGSVELWIRGAVLLALGVAATASAAGKRRPGPPAVERLPPEVDPRAPQLAQAEGVFHALSPGDGPALGEPALVVCRVQASVERKWDAFAEPDLLVELSLGRSHARIRGPEDRYVGYVSVPGVRLSAKDKVRLRLFDRDVFEDEYIGSAELRVTGDWPLRLESAEVSGECRALFGEALERAVSDELARADEQLEAAERHGAANAFEPGWGFPALAVLRAKGHLHQAAAHVGWEEARAGERVSRLAAFERRFEAGRAEAAVAAWPRARGLGTKVELSLGVRVAVREVSCRPSERCWAKLELEVEGRSAPRVMLGWTAEVVGEDGRGQLASPRPEPEGEVQPPQEQGPRRRAFRLEWEGREAAPRLLRLEAGGQVRVLRLAEG